jgi:hypothetical protein
MTRRLLLALSLLALCSAPLALYAQGKTVRTAGIVKTVSDTSLTITGSGGKEMTFTMDSTTRFKGKGLGTKSQEGKLTPSTATGVGDRVSVDYRDTSGTLHATQVTVNAKAPMPKP